MSYYKKYLKYKKKYLKLKGGSEFSENICVVCPSKEEVGEQLDEIIKILPPGSMNYAFIPETLSQPIKDHYKNYGFDQDIPEVYTKPYDEYLRKQFFHGIENVFMNSHGRLTVTNYHSIEENSVSSSWHRDDEGYYNVFCYLELNNCRHDCGVDIAYKDSESNTVTIKLPIIEGLIILFKDDYFAHKSPIVTLIDPEKVGTRLFIRTYVNIAPENEEDLIKRQQTDEIINELNTNKIQYCLEQYFNNDTSQEIKADCYHLIYIYRSEILNNPIYKSYIDEHREFFENLKII
jgi:hypothetical protein